MIPRCSHPFSSEQHSYLYLWEAVPNPKLGLRQPLLWIFIVADVQKPIIGAYFLRHFGLLVHMKQHQWIDATTCFHIQGIFSTDPSPIPSICPQDTSHPYHTFLSEFSTLTQFAHLTHLLSIISFIILKPEVHQFQLVPDAWHLTDSVQRGKNLSTCSCSESSVLPPVPGLCPYTWS